MAEDNGGGAIAAIGQRHGIDDVAELLQRISDALADLVSGERRLELVRGNEDSHAYPPLPSMSRQSFSTGA
jgi:hypothetical protein